jgi:hypothetical protein
MLSACCVGFRGTELYLGEIKLGWITRRPTEARILPDSYTPGHRIYLLDLPRPHEGWNPAILPLQPVLSIPGSQIAIGGWVLIEACI